MRALAHPLRLDSEGAFATVEQGGAREARQLAAGIVSTTLGERPLAPDMGIFDPVTVGLSRGEVVAAIGLGEPDLVVVDVAIGRAGDRQSVAVTVAWDEEATRGV